MSYRVITKYAEQVAAIIEVAGNSRAIIRDSVDVPGLKDVVFSDQVRNELVRHGLVEIDARAKEEMLRHPLGDMVLFEVADDVKPVDYTKKKNNYLLRSNHRDSLVRTLIAAEVWQVVGRWNHVDGVTFYLANRDGAWRANVNWQVKRLEKYGFITVSRRSDRAHVWMVRITLAGSAALAAAFNGSKADVLKGIDDLRLS